MLEDLFARWYPDQIVTDDGADTHDSRERTAHVVGRGARGLSAPEISSGRDL